MPAELDVLQVPTPGGCVVTDATHHSDDLVTVHHGAPEPFTACGYHLEARGVTELARLA